MDDGGIGPVAAVGGAPLRVDAAMAKLHRVRATVCAMLAKRGYAISTEDRSMDLETFVRKVSFKRLEYFFSSMKPPATAWYVHAA